MVINPNALFLLVILIIVLLAVSCFLFVIHLKDEKEQKEIFSKMKQMYIKPTPVLFNAVFEAYEQACVNENEFEQKAYQRLMQEIKEKW